MKLAVVVIHWVKAHSVLTNFRICGNGAVIAAESRLSKTIEFELCTSFSLSVNPAATTMPLT